MPNIDPNPTWARTSYKSIRGEITSSWTRNDGLLTLEVTIPANTTARIHLTSPANEKITEGGRALTEAEGVTILRGDDSNPAIEIGSGSYRFVAALR